MANSYGIYKNTIVGANTFGQFVRQVTSEPSEIAAQLNTGESFILLNQVYSELDTKHYIPVLGGDNVILARPTSDIIIDTETIPADGVTPITLTNCPIGGLLEVVGPVITTSTIATTTVLITFTVVGIYQIFVTSFPSTQFGATAQGT